jgi:hypothetical protein
MPKRHRHDRQNYAEVANLTCHATGVDKPDTVVVMSSLQSDIVLIEHFSSCNCDLKKMLEQDAFERSVRS